MINYSITTRDIKTRARALLRGHYERFAILVLLYGAVRFIFSIIPSYTFSDTSSVIMLAMFFIVSYLLQIVAEMFFIGISKTSLNIARGGFVSLTDITYAFKNQSNSFLLLETILVGISTALQIPAIFVNMESFVGIAAYFIIIALSLFLSTLFTIRIRFAAYVLMDRPGYTLTLALRESIDITRGKFFKILKLNLSFIPMYALCVLSYATGFLLVIPYTQTANALIYDEIL